MGQVGCGWKAHSEGWNVAKWAQEKGTTSGPFSVPGLLSDILLLQS